MGNYAVIADITARLQNWPTLSSFGEATRPTQAQVEGFITQIEGEINGVLSAEGYATVPASGAGDVQLLKMYTADKVAAKVWGVVFGGAEMPAQIKQWHEDYRDFIARLRRGEQHLPDQQPQSEDEPVFGIVRHPERDDTFTYRYDAQDWDE